MHAYLKADPRIGWSTHYARDTGQGMTLAVSAGLGLMSRPDLNHGGSGVFHTQP